MEKDLDIKTWEAALDIFEQSDNLSEAQLTALHDDGELRDGVALVHEVSEALRSSGPMDVEARLQLFHARMDNKAEEMPQHHRGRTVIMSLFGIAAAILVAVFFLHIGSGSKEEMPHGMVFAADGQRNGITLTTDSGDKVALATTGAQNRSISLSDFQEVLAKVGVSEKVTLDVPYGSSADITLPDGSVVYMHPGARLIFPNRFTGDRREVIFQGEAYFKVAHDPQHPFVISSGTMETTVLGTEFNISTDHSSVVLVKGSVRLRNTDNDAHVLLHPHQQAVMSADNPRFSVCNVDVEPYEFWRDGYLYFEEAELKDIMEAIGKNFNMSVVFRNEKALHYRMRFITKRNKGVEAALKTMNEMGKAVVSVRDNTIFVE